MTATFAKQCYKCNLTKPLEDFHKDVRRGDGHCYKCKECARDNAYEHKMGKKRPKREYVHDTFNENNKKPPVKCSCSEKSYLWQRENPCTH